MTFFEKNKKLLTFLVVLGGILFFSVNAVITVGDPVISWEKDCNRDASDPNCIFPVTSEQETASFNCLGKNFVATVIKGSEFHSFIGINNNSDIDTTFTCRNCATGANISKISNSMAELKWPAIGTGATRFQIVVSATSNQEKLLYGALCVSVENQAPPTAPTPPPATAGTGSAGATANSANLDTLRGYANQLNKTQAKSLPVLLGIVIRGLMGVIGSIALVMIIYGGVLWMTARGNSEQTSKAKSTVVWATLGIVLIFASYALVNFVFEIFK